MSVTIMPAFDVARRSGSPEWLTTALAGTLAAVWGCSTSASGSGWQGQKAYGAKMAKQGYWREALFRFEKAAKESPDDAEIQNNLAVAYEANGETVKALAAYRRAIELARTTRASAATTRASPSTTPRRRGCLSRRGPHADPHPDAGPRADAEPRAMKTRRAVAAPRRARRGRPAPRRLVGGAAEAPDPPEARRDRAGADLDCALHRGVSDVRQEGRRPDPGLRPRPRIPPLPRKAHRAADEDDARDDARGREAPVDRPEGAGRGDGVLASLGARTGADLLLAGVVDFRVEDKSGYRTEEYMSPIDRRTYYRQVFVESTGFTFEVTVLAFDGRTGRKLFRRPSRTTRRSRRAADEMVGLFENLFAGWRASCSASSS